MTIALARGGRQFLGWGFERHLMADILDSINVNTKATGNWKKGKAPDFPVVPRPDAKPVNEEGKPRVTVADLYSRFSGRT